MSGLSWLDCASARSPSSKDCKETKYFSTRSSNSSSFTGVLSNMSTGNSSELTIASASAFALSYSLALLISSISHSFCWSSSFIFDSALANLYSTSLFASSEIAFIRRTEDETEILATLAGLLAWPVECRLPFCERCELDFDETRERISSRSSSKIRSPTFFLKSCASLSMPAADSRNLLDTSSGKSAAYSHIACSRQVLKRSISDRSFLRSSGTLISVQSISNSSILCFNLSNSFR